MEKPGSKSTLAWLQRLVFVLIWVSVVYVCPRCFNAKYYFLLRLLFSLEKNCPREDAQILFPPCRISRVFIFLACFTNPMWTPGRAVWSGNDVTVLSSVSPPWEGCPDRPAPSSHSLLIPASFKAWWAMSPEHGILGDAHLLCLLGKPSQVMLVPLHQRSQLRDYEIRMTVGKHK